MSERKHPSRFPGKTQISFWLDDNLAQRLRLHRALEKEPQGKLLDKLLKDYFAKHPITGGPF